VKCKTITEAAISADSRIDRVQFDLDVAKLLHRCQCVKMLFSALQLDCKRLDFLLYLYLQLIFMH